MSAEREGGHTLRSWIRNWRDVHLEQLVITCDMPRNKMKIETTLIIYKTKEESPKKKGKRNPKIPEPHVSLRLDGVDQGL